MSFTMRRKQVPPDLARCRFRRTDDVLATRQSEELVLLDARGERYYTLNDVGSIAWNALAEPSTQAEVVEAIRRELDASAAPEAAVVERDVARLLEQLATAGLVSIEREPGGAAS